ncbi:CPBP family intramembrane metalloprotease [bacterium]|nr:CPBP family intramembrane metalloprotease [bacterium]
MESTIVTSTTVAHPEHKPLTVLALAPFLLITFAIAWTILALYIFLPAPMSEVFGTLSGHHPLFFLAVYAPAIAAGIIVARCSGPGGFRRYLSRSLLWRCSPGWWSFLIIGIPLIFVAGSWWKGNLFSDPFPFSSWQALLVGMLLATIKGPVEEFGWRGLALPLLQRTFTPIVAGLILGVIWGLWHLPAFMLSTTQQSDWSFAPFFVGCIALSIIVTPLFNASRGSILLPAIFHMSVMNPVLPDAQPYDTYLLIVVAALVVWFNRTTMFTRHGSVTEVIPPLQREVKR